VEWLRTLPPAERDRELGKVVSGVYAPAAAEPVPPQAEPVPPQAEPVAPVEFRSASA
jgi:hypothetical protein